MKFYPTVLAAFVATATFLPTSTAKTVGAKTLRGSSNTPKGSSRVVRKLQKGSSKGAPPAPVPSLETCVITDTPFDAGFGGCSTYAEGLGNNSFCDQDVDSNGILAQDACAECGVCVEAAVCIVGETPFDAGFGDCSTYAEGLINNSFCSSDVDSNGVVAQDACAECGLCVEPVPSLETCVETEAPFNAGFGDCSTYAEGLTNNGFCSTDVDSNGVVAEDACAECGVCAPACVATGVPFDAGFGDCSTYAEGLTNNGFCSSGCGFQWSCCRRCVRRVWAVCLTSTRCCVVEYLLSRRSCSKSKIL